MSYLIADVLLFLRCLSPSGTKAFLPLMITPERCSVLKMRAIIKHTPCYSVLIRWVLKEGIFCSHRVQSTKACLDSLFVSIFVHLLVCSVLLTWNTSPVLIWNDWTDWWERREHRVMKWSWNVLFYCSSIVLTKPFKCLWTLDQIREKPSKQDCFSQCLSPPSEEASWITHTPPSLSAALGPYTPL